MSELSIVLSGVIEKSNFDEWKTDLVEKIRSVKTDLTTDDDFAAASKHVKQFKAAEKSLKQAKKSALEQAAEINALFEAIDTVSEEARQARLNLDKQIKKRKKEIKQDFIAEGVETIEAFIQQQSKEFQSINHSNYTDEAIFADALSGKASTKGMQKAITKTCESIKESISKQAATVDANATTLNALPANQRALFQDRAQLMVMSVEQLNETIDERVAKLEAVGDSESADRAAVVDEPQTNETTKESDVAASRDPDSDKAEYLVTVEITATEEDADAIRSIIVDALSGNAAIGNIILSAK